MRSMVARLSTLFVIGAWLLMACGSPTPSSTSAATTGGTAALAGDPVPLGVAVAETSNTAALGQEQVIGVTIAEKYFNDHGGINGRPLKIIRQDTAGDENGAINAFNALINQSKVLGIVGPTLSQQAFAADKIADTAKVPVVGPSNTAKGVPQIGPYVARVSAPVSVVAPNAVKAALKQNPQIKKVSVLFAQNDAFSKSETGTFQHVITTTSGLQLLPVQTFQTTDTDFTSQATTVLNQNPDLVIISGLAVDGGNLVKQLRELGYKGLIIGGNGFNTPNIYPVCKAQCDGLLIAQAYSYELNSPVNNDFRKSYQDLQKQEPGQLAAQAFAGVQVFVKAMSAVDKATPLKGLSIEAARTAINDQLLKGKYQTPLGPISFTAEGEVVQNDFYVAQVKMNADGATGKFVLLK